MTMNKSSWIFWASIAAVVLMLWICISFKCLILAIALTGLGFYIHITITTLTKLTILNKKDLIDLNSDGFWKIVSLITAIVGFSIYFNI